MPKKVKEQGAMEVSRLVTPGAHAVGGVSGLLLQVSESGARSWLLRFMVGGKRREMGLGGYPDVTLAQAREKARAARQHVTQGVDPVAERKAARDKLRITQATALSFKQCAEKYIEGHKAGWRSAKHAAQWGATLEAYAYPVLGALPVSDITTALVLRVLEQSTDPKAKDGAKLWLTKTETASRVRGRMESVLDWAKGRGYRQGDNPAAWKGNLDALLPRPEKVSKVEHHAAVAVGEVGAFMVRLRGAEGMGARALEFAILTAARSGEVRGATWAEIDKGAKVWTVPGNRMKAGKEHRVPLSDAAMALLEALPGGAAEDPVFPAPRGGALSDMTISAVMRRMGMDAVPHGFRSTFRDWAAERTNYPREAAEMALAHAIGDKVEAAYRRGNLFEKRRRMMAEWAVFVSKVESKANVVPIRAA